MKKTNLLYIVTLTTICNVWTAAQNETPIARLLRAIEENNVTLLEEVLREDRTLADRHIVGSDTALILAAEQGKTPIVKALLKTDTYANAKNRLGRTPLILAVIGGHIETVKALLKEQKRVNVNSQDNGGATALIYAANKGNDEATELLLDAGAHIDKKTNSGKDALTIATEKGHQAIAKLIDSYLPLTTKGAR
jgi:ankyrin repeat protein